ncbi:hypothetical protein F2Q69_00041878 [Brassica cretica]|uniref:Uncharacterized protein n=1 Tax=Brassica cretica TaxID=69181 RepID=A0A8S9NCF1_BRACR|nr:hypothetical protein F2Q69_00041878 [Brassica cretica]
MVRGELAALAGRADRVAAELAGRSVSAVKTEEVERELFRFRKEVEEQSRRQAELHSWALVRAERRGKRAIVAEMKWRAALFVTVFESFKDAQKFVDDFRECRGLVATLYKSQNEDFSFPAEVDEMSGLMNGCAHTESLVLPIEGRVRQLWDSIEVSEDTAEAGTGVGDEGAGVADGEVDQPVSSFGISMSGLASLSVLAAVDSGLLLGQLLLIYPIEVFFFLGHGFFEGRVLPSGLASRSSWVDVSTVEVEGFLQLAVHLAGAFHHGFGLRKHCPLVQLDCPEFRNQVFCRCGLLWFRAGLCSWPSPLRFPPVLGGGGRGGGEGSTGLFPNNLMTSADRISTGAVPSLFSSSMQNPNSTTHMSATALLQKAAQIGSSSSNNNNSNNASSILRSFGSGMYGESESNLNDLMNSFSNPGATGNNVNRVDSPSYGGVNKGLNADKQSMTRDFLGVGQIVRSMSESGGFQQQKQQQQHGNSTERVGSSSDSADRNSINVNPGGGPASSPPYGIHRASF